MDLEEQRRSSGLRDRDEAEGGPEAYSALVQLAAATLEGADGLIVLPYLAGELTSLDDPSAKGVVFGLEMAHRRGHLFRAAFEGVGYSIAHDFEAMREAGAELRTAVAVGGGVKNPHWLQAVSDISGVPQHVPEVTLGASYGNAFLAGLAIGAIDDPSRIGNWVQVASEVRPRPEHAALYARQFSIYKDLYRHTRDLMAALDG